jgi:hypothetical protein
VAGLFISALVVAAGLLALWVDARFPGLAPESFSKRMLAAACAMGVFGIAPVFGGSARAVYATVFAILLPLLVCMLLTAVWLLRALREAQLNT